MMDSVPTPSFDDVFDCVSSFLAMRYGLTVEVGELGVTDRAGTSASEIANLREGKVRLSPERSREQQGFVLAHVFGHLVQHLNAARYSGLIALVESPPPIEFDPAEERAYLAFEMEASAWGEALMRACMPVPEELRRRFAAYAMTDFTTYLSYLKTGVQTDAEKFQKMFARRAATDAGPLWNADGRVLPPSLVLGDVNISIL